MTVANGVRFELVRRGASEDRAVYDAVVETPAGSARLEVEIVARGEKVEATARALEGDEAVYGPHVAQLVALARTLGKKRDEGWPRRLNRWRQPGVR